MRYCGRPLRPTAKPFRPIIGGTDTVQRHKAPITLRWRLHRKAVARSERVAGSRIEIHQQWSIGLKLHWTTPAPQERRVHPTVSDAGRLGSVPPVVERHMTTRVERFLAGRNIMRPGHVIRPVPPILPTRERRSRPIGYRESRHHRDIWSTRLPSRRERLNRLLIRATTEIERRLAHRPMPVSAPAVPRVHQSRIAGQPSVSHTPASSVDGAFKHRLTPAPRQWRTATVPAPMPIMPDVHQPSVPSAMGPLATSIAQPIAQPTFPIPDMNRMVDEVIRRIDQQARIERHRRGL